MGRVGSGGPGRLSVFGAIVCLAVVAASPASAQSPSPSAGRSGQAGVITLGADRELLRDDLQPVVDWGLMDREAVRIEPEDGGLRFRLQGQDRSNWSWRSVGEIVPVMRAGVATAIEAGRGDAGPMCGAAGDDDTFYEGVVATNGDWLIGRIVDSEVTWIARGALAGGPPEPSPVRIELECAVTGDGGDRLALFVDGVNVADVSDAESLGPFDKVGLVAGVEQGRFRVGFDDVVVLGGDGYAPQVDIDGGPDRSPTASPVASPVPASPAPTDLPLPSAVAPTPLPVGALLDAVPAAFASDCRTFDPDVAAGQLEAVLCVPAGGVDVAEYYRYDSLASLEAAFTRLVPAGADPTGTDCAVEPSMLDYTANGRSAGVLACYTDPRTGVTMQWSNRDLLVLAFGSTRDGTFADAFAWWQDAGPLP